MLISVEEIKIQLRIDREPDSDLDPELENIYASAADYCARQIGRPLVDSERPNLNPSVRAAILLVIGDLYKNREGQGEKSYNENPMVEKLLDTQKVGWGI